MTGKAMFRTLKKLSSVYLTIPVIGFAIAYFSYSYFQEPTPPKRKKGTGIPGSLKQMDLWGDMRTYPNTTLDASEFATSYRMTKQMAVAQASGTGPNAPVNTSPWVNLAPMNFAGRILSIGFNPLNPLTMWVGSASGGLWKTTCGGTGGPGGISWTYIPTGAFPVLGIGSIAVSPADSNTIYVGTGEVYSANPGGSTGAGHVRVFRGSYGIGILKSTNNGATWTKTLDFTNTSLKGVSDIVIHPTNTNIVFAATTDGLYRTTNGGGSWTLIHSAVYAMDLLFKPDDPSILYFTAGNFQSAGTGIYRASNCTAATPTFTQFTSASFPSPISGKIQLAISAANTSRIYASIGRDPNATSHTQGLYISTNGGSTWAAAPAASILGNQGWYAHDVAVSPTNANNVIWGELDTYLSTNGGTSFTKTGSWSQWDVTNTTVGDLTEAVSNMTNYVHADVHRIQQSPHNNNTFFLCTDGGLFRTTDGGATFNTLNGGLNTAQIYSNMAQHPTNPNYMLIGLQDNEAMIYEGNPGSRRIGSLGDGFHAAMNFNGTIQLVESYYFNRRRSTNSGGTWGSGSGAVPTSEVACFNVPMVFSRAPSSTRMYAGTVLFKRSANSGSTWTDLNGGAPIAGANNPAISMVAPTNNRVYFSTGPGSGVRSKIWRTNNAEYASPVFTEITGTLPDRYYSGMDVDPIDSNRIVITLSGFGSSHVFISHNAGATWSDMGGGLPDVPHNSVFINPSARNQIYVSNDLGVFVTNNAPISGALGATTSVYWNDYSEGLGEAIMANHIVLTSSGKLRLATYGRGLWERDIAALTIPVVWKQFRAWSVEKGNQLQWIVSSQSNLKHYEIEFSRNGTQFTKLATVMPNNGAGDITYNYLHEFDKNTDMFYRIKQVDNDGAFKYSSVVMVKASRLITHLTAFPNPTTGLFNIKLTAQNVASIDVKVYNITGSLLTQQRQQLRPGQNTIPMDIARLPAGTYQVVCEGESGKQTLTILKK